MKEINDYYNNPRISQSALKDFMVHPMLYKAKHIDKSYTKQKKNYFELGSLVDCLVLTPEYFEEIYSIYTGNKISPQVRILAEEVVLQGLDNSSYEVLLETAKKLNILGTIKKIDTFKNKLLEENFDEYHNFFYNNSSKNIIDEEFYGKAIAITSSLLTSEFSNKYFNISRKGFEVLTATPIYWLYNGVKCKSLIDLIVIDHNTKTISVNDLKTTAENTSDFEKSIMKYRYDFQAAFYLEAVKWWIKNERTELADYEVLDEFSLLVESTTRIGSPLCYTLHSSTVQIGKEGCFYRDRNGITARQQGFEEVILDLVWAKENDIWHYKKEEYENKGVVLIKHDNSGTI